MPFHVAAILLFMNFRWLVPWLVGFLLTNLNFSNVGLCPLTPEEYVLMLVAVGFNHKHTCSGGALIHGGQSRLTLLVAGASWKTNSFLLYFTYICVDKFYPAMWFDNEFN